MSNDWWVGLFLGIFITSFCFWMKKFCDDIDGKRYAKWNWYSIERGTRVCGVLVNHIIDGKWAGGIVSLWRSSGGDFFLVEINEIDNKRIITPLNRLDATVFVRKYASKDADQILKDWFGIPIKNFIET